MKRKKNKLDLIRPNDNLKFQLKKDVYKNSLSFELGKVHTKKSFNVVSDKVFNFGILRSKKTKKTIGEKRRMVIEIIDTICVLGLQIEEQNYLNPITVSITSNDVILELKNVESIDIDMFWKVFYLVRISKMIQMSFSSRATV